MDRVVEAHEDYIRSRRHLSDVYSAMGNLDESLYALTRETLTLRMHKNELLLILEDLAFRLQDESDEEFDAVLYMKRVRDLYVTKPEQEEGESLGEGIS